MPDATEEEREAARENLRNYAKVVVGIAKRLVKEERERAKETPTTAPSRAVRKRYSGATPRAGVRSGCDALFSSAPQALPPFPAEERS